MKTTDFHHPILPFPSRKCFCSTLCHSFLFRFCIFYYYCQFTVLLSVVSFECWPVFGNFAFAFPGLLVLELSFFYKPLCFCYLISLGWLCPVFNVCPWVQSHALFRHKPRINRNSFTWKLLWWKPPVKKKNVWFFYSGQLDASVCPKAEQKWVLHRE